MSPVRWSSISAYAVSRKILLTLDSGHFHPTETIADKISSLLLYLDQLLLHVSRGVRWDSDHVVTFTDDLQAIAREIVRNNALERVHIGLDYFDASINRIAAWTIGARNTLRALLLALLEPHDRLRQLGSRRRFLQPAGAAGRTQGACLSMRSGIIIAAQEHVPIGMDFMQVIKEYEKRELLTAELRCQLIKLFASLRKLTGKKEVTLPGTSLHAVLENLVREFPTAAAIPAEGWAAAPGRHHHPEWPRSGSGDRSGNTRFRAGPDRHLSAHCEADDKRRNQGYEWLGGKSTGYRPVPAGRSRPIRWIWRWRACSSAGAAWVHACCGTWLARAWIRSPRRTC